MARKKLPRGFIYARVGVRIFDHPVLAEAGWAGVLLMVRAITYGREHLTDGRVPKAEVRRWLRQIEDEFGGFDASFAVDALLRRGVWTDDDVAIYVDDFADYQETRSEVAEQSQQGKAAAEKRHSKPDSCVTHASRMANACLTHAQTETETEVLVEKQPSPSRAKAPSNGFASINREKPDPLWDALVSALELSVGEITPRRRSKLKAAVFELRQVGATPDEIKRRARQYKREHPDWAFTETALANHWAALASSKPKRPAAAVEPEPSEAELVPPPPEAIEAMRRLGMKTIDPQEGHHDHSHAA